MLTLAAVRLGMHVMLPVSVGCAAYLDHIVIVTCEPYNKRAMTLPNNDCILQRQWAMGSPCISASLSLY